MTDTPEPTKPDPRERLAHHLAEMEAWLNGSRSHTNRISQNSCSPELSALTEAASIQADTYQSMAHAVAAQAWAATLALSGENFYIDLRAAGAAR